MPRGTYRTGARRDRRIKDPGFPPYGNPQLSYMEFNESFPTAGGWTLQVQALAPATGGPYPTDHVLRTGQATKARVIDSMGVEHIPVVTVNSVGVVEYSIASGLAAGDARLMVPAWDGSVRGVSGEWLSPYSVVATIL